VTFDSSGLEARTGDIFYEISTRFKGPPGNSRYTGPSPDDGLVGPIISRVKIKTGNGVEAEPNASQLRLGFRLAGVIKLSYAQHDGTSCRCACTTRCLNVNLRSYGEIVGERIFVSDVGDSKESMLATRARARVRVTTTTTLYFRVFRPVPSTLPVNTVAREIRFVVSNASARRSFGIN